MDIIAFFFSIMNKGSKVVMCSVVVVKYEIFVKYHLLAQYRTDHKLYKTVNRQIMYHFLICRTPLMAAMHEDDSPELTEVARILNDVLEVDESLFSSLGLFVHQMNFFFWVNGITWLMQSLFCLLYLVFFRFQTYL